MTLPDPRVLYHASAPFATADLLPHDVINQLCDSIVKAADAVGGGNYTLSAPFTWTGTGSNVFSLLGQVHKAEFLRIGIGLPIDNSQGLKMSGNAYIQGFLNIDTGANTPGMSVFGTSTFQGKVSLAGIARTIRASATITGSPSSPILTGVATATRFHISALNAAKVINIDYQDGPVEGDSVEFFTRDATNQVQIGIWNGTVFALDPNTVLKFSAGFHRWAEYEWRSGSWVSTRKQIYNSAEF